MKKLLLTLAVVFLLAAVVIAVKPTGERQGTEEGSAPPVTGVFGQCGNDGQCDDGDPYNGAEWCDKSTAPGHCEDCVPTDEVCDGLDNDCNGVIDEGTIICGVGACENTVDMCVEGAPNECLPLEGSEEICDDQIDNDCDGLTDEDCAPTCDDGIQNGNERGVDCGGICPPCGGTCDDPSTECGSYTVCAPGCGGIDNGYCFPTTEDGVGACIANWWCSDQTKRCGDQSDCSESELCTSSCCDVETDKPFTCIPNTLFCEPVDMMVTKAPTDVKETAGTAANP